MALVVGLMFMMIVYFSFEDMSRDGGEVTQVW